MKKRCLNWKICKYPNGIIVAVWTKKEINFIKNNYHKLTRFQISQKIGRSEGSIAWKLKQLELRKMEG